MRGSRTNFNEAKKWIQSSDYTVIQAAMTDKFGDMGVVSIIVQVNANTKHLSGSNNNLFILLNIVKSIFYILVIFGCFVTRSLVTWSSLII